MNWKKLARAALSLSGVAIFVIILLMGGMETIERVLHGDLLYVLAGMAAIFGITLIGSLRWRLLVGALTDKPLLPVHQIYHYNIIGRLISLFAPRGVGDFAGRPLALQAGKGSSFGRALYSTLLDRVFDYFLMLLMLIPALLYVGHLVSLEVGTALTVILMAAFFFVVASRFGQVVHYFHLLLSWGLSIGRRLPIIGRFFRSERVQRLQELEELEIDFRTAGQAYLYSILQVFLMLLRSYWIARALGLHFPFMLLLLAIPVSQLGVLLAFTPGALGIRELSWFGVLQAAGIPSEDLLVFLIGHRAYIYVSIIALALLSHLAILIRGLLPSRPASVGSEQPHT